MVPPTRTQFAVGVIATLLVLAGLGLAMRHSGSGSTAPVAIFDAGGAPAQSDPRGTAGVGPGPGTVLVDVAGAVRRPGVYPLRDGQRVRDAIERAGGASPEADLTAVNRASRVVDGQQVLVPAKAIAVAGAAPGNGASAGIATKAPVSLNSADAAALDTLQGIGPVTAQRIVDDRARNGPFRRVEDLDRVSGIGASTVASLTGLVTL